MNWHTSLKVGGVYKKWDVEVPRMLLEVKLEYFLVSPVTVPGDNIWIL